jgi:hypothetical protein
MSKFLVGGRSDGIYEALHQAGVFKEDPRNVRRIIIDLEAGSAARTYVEMFVDDVLIDVVMQGSLNLTVPDEEAA